MKNSALISLIEQSASLSLQEKWDNSGLQVGSPLAECTGVLVCLDPTPAVVDEAISKGCNLIISHHPLFFKPVKRLTGTTLQEATALKAIAAGITIYSSHTACDSAEGGVSYLLAKRLGVDPKKTLAPVSGRLVALHTMVPEGKADEVRLALFDAGAGALGNYDCCSFNINGIGTFRPLEGSNPYVGTPGEGHAEKETQITVALTSDIMGRVESALLETHPYETPAYSFIPLLNSEPQIGLGVYGISEEGLNAAEFTEMVKERLGCQAVRCSAINMDPETKIRRVAVCGGAGGEFISKAVSMGAQAFVTADVRYHDFVDFRDQILLIDAGHFETEAPFKDFIADMLKKGFPMVPVYTTSTKDNPIKYV
ncbi:MAG: Nif3-like dinuclear metal center hexameric protein [Clostridium sp.]|nr:Nif3-like dinuclear metal center hexameric protein [Clostridium sp.]